jgi:glutamine amidotransferase
MRGVILDLGINNIQSLQHKVSRLGVNTEVGESEKDLHRADFILLPGLGHFGEAMTRLHERNLVKTLEELVLRINVPILGICLGMQLFSDTSEEGNAPGLGWISGKTVQFKSPSRRISIPHIGWTTLKQMDQISSPLYDGVDSKKHFYFVHSYHVECDDRNDILTTSIYQGIEFVSSIRRKNIFGTQFHPEKSHRDGMNVFWNFLTCSGLV